ncbi:hypothetical protein ACOACQ_23215 [Nocardioides sp. CPCC 206347]|uniref:hypothetical protein n=1 Tax=unclassified Nocardioides TaxID=2615069 RepID=UPI003613FADD
MATMHSREHLTHDMREELHDLTNFSSIDSDRQGRVALWVTFTVLAIVWGLDMMVGFMTDTWDSYVSVWANNFLPGDASDATMWIGALTVALGVLLAAAPHFGADVLGIWLVVLAINVFSVDDLAHLGVGMLALAFCCFALARMARGNHKREA